MYRDLNSKLLAQFHPDVVMHLSSESHVDRPIEEPSEFIPINRVGTSVMLECAREYWKHLPTDNRFRFYHISTDEISGSLDDTGLFTEETRYDPSSLYSASKSRSDHLCASGITPVCWLLKHSMNKSALQDIQKP